MEAAEAYEAVVKLLEGNGVYCASDDVSVKRVTTQAGHTLYVAIALNGIASAVESALTPLISLRPCGIYGVWVLRELQAGELIRTATSRPHSDHW